MITNPPTTLLVAAMIAIVPRIVASVPRILIRSGQNDRSHHRDRIQRVRQRHQRRVQQGRDPANHFKSDKRREHEHVKGREQIELHFMPPGGVSAATIARRFRPVRRSICISLPFDTNRVSCRGQRTPHPSVDDLAARREQGLAHDLIASIESELSLLHQMDEKRAQVCRIHLAGVIGNGAGEVEPADDGDAVLDDAARPRLVSSQLPPRSAARSMITEPGAMLVTTSRVTSSGDFLPGITAAVITTSLSATTFASSSRWRS